MKGKPRLMDAAKNLAKKALGVLADKLLPPARTDPASVPAPAISPAVPPAAPATPVVVEEPGKRLPDSVAHPFPGDREPLGMLDLEEPPETYGINEVGLLAQDPYWLLAWWEATPGGWEQARARLGGDGDLTLRLHSVTTPGDESENTIDHRLSWDQGRTYVPAPAPGATVTGTLGLLARDGQFAPIALSPRIRVPWAGPGQEEDVEWLEVAPRRPRDAARAVPTPRPPQQKPRIRAEREARDHAEHALRDRTPGSPLPPRQEDIP